MFPEPQPQEPIRLPPFAYAVESAAFETRWFQEVIKRYHTRVVQIVPVENIQKFAHGRGWSFRDDQGEDGAGHFEPHTVEHMMLGSESMDCDMSAVGRHVDAMVDKFMIGMQQGLVQTAEAATEKSGNIVHWSQNPQDAPEAYLQMIQQVDCGVDEDGNPTLPSFLQITAEFRSAIEQHAAAHPEYRAEVEKLRAAKIQAALEREAVRKAKFKGPA